jgi:hypothetical protein
MPECLGDVPCLHLLELLAPPPTQLPCEQLVRFVRFAKTHGCVGSTAWLSQEWGGSPRRLKARKCDCLQSDDQDGDIDLRDALGDLAYDQRRQLGLRDARSSSNARANDGSRSVLLSMESSGDGCQERPVERSLLHPPARV